MRTADVDILIAPGLEGGSPDHWYSRWEQKLPTARRVLQADWHRPRLVDWTDALVAAVAAATRPVVLVGHSLGAVAIVQAAPRLVDAVATRIAGAFLVAPPSPDVLRTIDAVDPGFAEMPREPLPFPTVLVASRDDIYASYATSEALAEAWGADLVDAGASGHLNDESGHGPWPEGLMRFAGFLKRLD